MTSQYKEINGTFYNITTNDQIASLLEKHRQLQTRLKFYYGDTTTGQACGDVEIGRIGRSTGTIKIPLVVRNKRSLGGGSLIDHCIVKIEYANRNQGGVIYQHPDFKEE